jgi:hexokinase
MGVGEVTDPVILMNKALKQENVNVRIKALLNDTTSTFLASYCVDKNTRIGIVLGTGTNGAYIYEKGNGEKVLINSEWGSFDTCDIKKTKYDEIIKDEIVKSDQKFNNLDCMIGGFRFIELLNLYARDRMGEEYETISFDDVKRIYYQENGNPLKNDSSELSLINDLKTRNAVILACLIASILSKDKINGKITISLNGSILENKEDRHLLEKETASILRAIYGENEFDISFVFIDNASLIGSVYALFYDGNIPE